MIPRECREVREKLDEYRSAALIGEAMERLDRHMQGCAACREFAETLDQVSAGVDMAGPDPFLERRVHNAILSDSHPKADPRSRRWAWLAVPIAAAACALAVLLWPGDPEQRPAEKPPVVAERDPSPEPSEPTAAALAVESQTKTTADGRRYIEVFEGTALWLDTDAVVEVEVLSGKLARFRLKSGRAVAQIGPHEPGFRFLVTTPSGAVEAKGTVFTVEVTRDGADRVRVLRGTVEVRTRDMEGGRLLSAGQAMVIGDTAYEIATDEDIERDRCLYEGCEIEPAEPDRPGRQRSATELAELARKYRGEKRYKQASKTYRRLIAQYPKSDAALRGTVHLAMMELDILGKADAALGHFNAYIEQAPNGPLAEASYIGRVRALSRANRQRAVLKAARQYLKRYPSSDVTAEMLRRQADALVQLGRCDEAIGLYRRISTSWPDSGEARRARAGLANCGAPASDS